MEKTAIQDYYSTNFAQCYGCGKLNEHGYQIKSYWEGDESVCRFTPEPYHTAIPGFVYGGLLASLVDCHGTGTAAAVKAREDGIDLSKDPAPRFVTAALKVDYLKPTPINGALVLRATPTEIKGRKITIEIRLFAGDLLCVKGEVIAINIPEGAEFGK
jgi:acyl-coenzyme A thioesterase PaaI-like protein